MKKLKNFELFGFHGFYDSIWSYCDSDSDFFCDDDACANTLFSLSNGKTIEECYEIIEKLSINERGELFEHNDEEYRKDVVNEYSRVYVSELEHLLGCEISVCKSELESPKEYNFRTDDIYCNINVSDDFLEKLLTKVDEQKERISKIIKEEWSSRDGFISFLSSSLDEWIEEIESDSENMETYISILCRYLLNLQMDCYEGDESFEDMMFEIVNTNGVYYDAYFEMAA